ncbi:GH36 C-terminal domain-containing protein [Paraburkholderia sediminicola]|uniref:GH36 C-terminal domain-containing protein n=1 Tax=Paraburkholderia sediminicola TaxID=458836 RepID=UPI0038B9586F
MRLLDANERGELVRWVALFKAWREVAHSGTIYQGAVEPSLAWLQVVAPDLGASLIAVYRLVEDANRYVAPVPVKGLDPARRYRVEILHRPVAPHFTKPSGLLASLVDGGIVLSGATLRDFGLPLPPMPPESAIVIRCNAVDD